MNQASPSKAITFNQIRARVAALSRGRPIRRPVGIRSAARWLGEGVHVDGETTFFIAQCDSPLALRLALKAPPPAGKTGVVRVLVTNLDDAAISPDIFARLHRPRLFTIDRWSLVQQQFAAESIDPRLVKHDWLADAVVEHLGGTRTATAKSGFLDAETLWRDLLAATIGLSADLPDLAAILKWSLDTARVRRLRALAPELRAGIEEWLRSRAGDAAEFVFAVADKTDEPDAVPLALVAGVLTDRRVRSRTDRAIGKLEGLWFGNRTVGVAQLERIGGEAAALVRTSMADPVDQRRTLARAEELLAEVDGSAHAHASPILPLGHAQRLGMFAAAVKEFLAAPSANTDAVEEVARQVRAHDQTHRNPAESERLEMATRLVRFLATRRRERRPAESLADAAGRFLAEGSFVDWARSASGRLAASRELSEGLDALHAAATREQEAAAQEFATLLAASVASGAYPADVLLIEQVLDAVVAPLAKAMPVLLIVLDGMSAAVCRELVDHLTRDRRDWLEIVEEGRCSSRPVIATVPSETKYSRASLLAGRFATDGADERAAFAAHRGLVEASAGGLGPVLHAKAHLSGTTVAEVVREEIASTKRRVVGVIVNAVDDHLAKADQILVRWTLDTIPVLEALLHDAARAGRAVILTSDHGHVLDTGTTARFIPGAAGGERWRAVAGPPPGPDEFALRGSRVAVPGGALVTSWSESVRYITATKRGYHGGISPQEMVVATSVLISSGVTEPAGWQPAPESTPPWWDRDGAAAASRPEPATPPKKPPGMLFDIHHEQPPVPDPKTVPPKAAMAATGAPDWTTAVIATDVFAAQKKLVTRGYPGDEILCRLLATLDARGGTLTSPALARTLGYATLRLPGLLSVAQRMFNVDGYQVISVDIRSDTVTLDKPTLLVQFGMSPEDARR
ncbi:MAG: BREX-2 system phosphatase PglZ [Planctomycetes bacterium]|nr:BREX-2 system phosphatase PglZ [Planctomycetota bacterium]